MMGRFDEWPGEDEFPIGIVGDGRVARHFTHYFNLLGLSVRGWSRRTSVAGPVETLAACQTVLLLIRDSEILGFINAWPDLQKKRLVHFSGGLVTDAVRGVHPLMAFGHELYLLD